MPPFAFDIDYYQVFKNGQHVCGDTFMTARGADGRIIAVLSDGLGSGVKANILSTMTAKMALKFVDANWDVKKYCEVISSVLPICKEPTRRIERVPVAGSFTTEQPKALASDSAGSNRSFSWAITKDGT